MMGGVGADRQTDRHLYLIIKLRVVPSGASGGHLLGSK